MKIVNTKNYILFLSASILSLIASFYMAGKYFKLDADTINSALVWSEIQTHGHLALKGWLPTDDNWYLSIYPIHFLIYSIFGNESINTLITISALQIFISALLAFLILNKFTTNKYAVLIIPASCILQSFCYSTGFVSHPFSHNVTNIYGLLSIYLLMCIRSSLLSSAISSVLIFIAGLSDPWFVAAYALPLLFYFFINDLKEKNRFLPSIVIILTLCLYFSHFFQHILGMPSSKFKLASIEIIYSNIYWYIHGIGSMLNLFHSESDLTKFISFFVAMTIGCCGLITLYLTGRKTVSLVLLISVVSISGAYILGEPEKQYYSARFLVNILYIFYISSFALLLSKSRARILAFLVLISIFISSLFSNSAYVSNNLVASSTDQVKFMEDNDLTYGFGPYWSGNPNVVSWLSKGKIDFNPVRFKSDNGFIDWEIPHPQSFKYKIKPENKKTFVMISSDGESCSNIEVCITGVKSQFGNPDTILTYGNSFFYIYKNGLK